MPGLEEPRDLERIGPNVWVGGHGTPAHERGIKVLGSPVGTADFIQAQAQERNREERRFLDMLPNLPDLQYAFALLLQCALPRSNHLFRSLPPSLAEEYERSHDLAIQRALRLLRGLGGEAGDGSSEVTHLRSALRTRHSAYWASWADAVRLLRKRVFPQAQALVRQLAGQGPSVAPCLEELNECCRVLEGVGFIPPSWDSIWNGLRPERRDEDDVEPGEWQHG